LLSCAGERIQGYPVKGMDASPGDAGLRMTAEDAAPDCEGVGTLVSGVSNLNSRAFITNNAAFRKRTVVRV